jgi:hypothetical protein
MATTVPPCWATYRAASPERTANATGESRRATRRSRTAADAGAAVGDDDADDVDGTDDVAEPDGSAGVELLHAEQTIATIAAIATTARRTPTDPSYQRTSRSVPLGFAIPSTCPGHSFATDRAEHRSDGNDDLPPSARSRADAADRREWRAAFARPLSLYVPARHLDVDHGVIGRLAERYAVPILGDFDALVGTWGPPDTASWAPRQPRARNRLRSDLAPGLGEVAGRRLPAYGAPWSGVGDPARTQDANGGTGGGDQASDA